MEGVLEGGALLTVCKVACSLPFLRSVSGHSPVTFCCCCLLLCTDVILTAFLSVLLVLDRWQVIAPSAGDAIALRCLLFISHMFAAVFLITLPAVIVDTFFHLQQNQDDIKDASKSTDQTKEKPTLRYHIVAYFCCLSLWTCGTLNIRWRWKLEEVWTAACLYSSDSLLTCLPNVYSPMMRFLSLCWVMTSVFLAVAIILMFWLLWRKSTVIRLRSPGVDTKIQMFADRDEELYLMVKDNKKRTEKVIPLTLTEERESAGPQSGNEAVFPCPGADVMIGVVCTLAMFLLPLNLSVNVYLISTVEKILKWGLKYFGLSNVMRHIEMDII